MTGGPDCLNKYLGPMVTNLISNRASVLVIGGKQDILTKHEASVELHKRIDQSTLISMDRSGHMGLVERYDMVNKEARDFICSGIPAPQLRDC